ncbi:Mobile element protein [Methanosarcina barkeri str. Wiesmoor]|uniref:Mobile element protein n=2 Tax=Methanosarcina barkeri TaxID=2208 RepID=A0A0E3QLY4_METBA|nr:Mobile element protein [Methanosarcina barkeri str. Wiesmoor]
MTLSPSSESTTHLGHYGLIAGVFDELEISDLIDTLLPQKSGHNIYHSTVLKAMCINDLGFTERCLYLFPAFFENLPTERLLGEGVLPESLNDDVFGRTLDKIQEYGATEIFNHIILQAMKHVPINSRTCHTDTTNFSVYGDYENDDNGQTINITHGHPKDKRVDLLRFSISMVTDQKGIPLFVRALDGNSSDKRGFRFLKDKSFRVSEVYLKKKSRIEALAMVMVLCLLLYSIAEWKLRTRLEEAKEAIRSQIKKKTQTPTMKYGYSFSLGE